MCSSVWGQGTDCGGCGWKDVGMVATHCAVMCGLFVHALRCALLLVSLVFVELFFGESPSLHYLFLHFLAKCFFCNLFWAFFLRSGNKCACVNVCSRWYWNGMCLRMCVVWVSICTPVSIRKAFACMCTGGGGGLLSRSAM